MSLRPENGAPYADETATLPPMIKGKPLPPIRPSKFGQSKDVEPISADDPDDQARPAYPGDETATLPLPKGNKGGASRRPPTVIREVAIPSSSDLPPTRPTISPAQSKEMDKMMGQVRETMEKPSGPKFMSKDEAQALFKDFTADQMPPGAKVSFKNWAFPPGQACTNERSTQVKGQKLDCNVCRTSDDKAPREAQQLGAYALAETSVTKSYGMFGEQSLVLNLDSKSGPLKLRCKPAELMGKVTDVTATLAELGVAFDFPYPKEAALKPKTKVETGSPATTAF